MDARLKSSNVEYFYTSELLTPTLIGPGRYAGVQIITRNAGRILIGCQLSGTVIAG